MENESEISKLTKECTSLLGDLIKNIKEGKEKRKEAEKNQPKDVNGNVYVASWQDILKENS